MKKALWDLMFATEVQFMMFEKLDPSNPECEASQVDVEDWIDADEGIVLSHTLANEDLINAIVNPDSESKTL
jgi:hypothetical protein